MSGLNPERSVLDSTRTERLETSNGEGFDVELTLPPTRRGVVLITNGQGTGTKSPRSRHVASFLRERELGTLLVECFCHEPPGGDEANADRILRAVHWLAEEDRAGPPPIGCLATGNSVGGALIAAAREPALIQALVVGGAVPDSVLPLLPAIKTPILIVLGSRDIQTLQRSHHVIERLGATHKRAEAVPGACEHFHEPGTLDAACIHAANWFRRFLSLPGVAAVEMSTAPPSEPSLSGDR